MPMRRRGGLMRTVGRTAVIAGTASAVAGGVSPPPAEQVRGAGRSRSAQPQEAYAAAGTRGGRPLVRRPDREAQGAGAAEGPGHPDARPSSTRRRPRSWLRCPDVWRRPVLTGGRTGGTRVVPSFRARDPVQAPAAQMLDTSVEPCSDHGGIGSGRRSRRTGTGRTKWPLRRNLSGGPENVGDDVAQLHTLGYAQELRRRMSGFSNFAVSFTIISVLSGCLTLYFFGMTYGGPVVIVWGWLIVGGMTLDRRARDGRDRLGVPHRRGVCTSGRAGSPSTIRARGAGSPAGSTSSARSPSPRESTTASHSSSPRSST